MFLPRLALVAVASRIRWASVALLSGSGRRSIEDVFRGEPLDIKVTHELIGAESILHISGEIDMATAAPFRDAALMAIAEHGPSLTVDLSGVTFMDSTGLHVLVGTYRRVRVHGGTFTLRNVPHIVRKLLRVTALDELLLPRGTAGTTAATTRAVDATSS